MQSCIGSAIVMSSAIQQTTVKVWCSDEHPSWPMARCIPGETFENTAKPARSSERWLYSTSDTHVLVRLSRSAGRVSLPISDAVQRGKGHQPYTFHVVPHADVTGLERQHGSA